VVNAAGIAASIGPKPDTLLERGAYQLLLRPVNARPALHRTSLTAALAARSSGRAAGWSP